LQLDSNSGTDQGLKKKAEDAARQAMREMITNQLNQREKAVSQYESALTILGKTQ
jgi:hypothetical protein